MRRLADDHGFTLIEFLWVVLIGVVVLGVAGQLLPASLSTVTEATSRTATTADAATTLERFTRELRHATAATVSDTGAVATAVLSVPIRTTSGLGAPATRSVTWRCMDGGSCTRQATGLDAGPVVVVHNVADARFTPVARDGSTAPSVTDPAFVGVELSTRVASVSDPARTRTTPHASRAITVRDGVDLRNFS